MVTELIDKYIWLLQKITAFSPRGITLEEISDAWESRYGTALNRRTFINHRDAVEQVFGVAIVCDRSTNRYRLTEGSLDNMDKTSEWLVNTYTVGNLLSMGKDKLRGRISVEEVPSGYRYLTELMQAMTDSRKVRINYRKYSSTASDTLTVQPWALKESARRWYLVGFADERQALRVYGLDRIASLDILEEGFSMPSHFDVEQIFAESFGPYLNDGGAVTVRFRTTPTEAAFLTDLPIHPSQRREQDTPEGPVFSIRVVPTVNLTMELCSHGDRLEVLSPESVRAEVITALENSLKQYK